MERTARDIEAQIAKLEAAKLTTQARKRAATLSRRMKYLRGELMLQRAEENRK